MMQKIINQIIDHDLLLSLRRSNDTKRYILAKWNQSHDEVLDEGQLFLFLCDEKYGALTEAQKAFVRECRSEMHGVYALVLFRAWQCYELICRGAVRDVSEYCEIFTPASVGEFRTSPAADRAC